MGSPTLDANEIRRRGRRRLIGAVAIALLLIVFVPMILDSEPQIRREEPAMAIPPRENAPPLPAPTGASATPPAPATAPPAAPEAPRTASVTPVAPPGAPARDAAPAKAAAPAKDSVSPKDAPKLEGFAVQVGAFKDETKLAQAREKLSGARIAHYTERLETPSGPLTRLRAGPFPTREAADAAATKIRGASLEGQVVGLP